MKRSWFVITLWIFSLCSVSLNATPITDLFKEWGVSYVYDIDRDNRLLGYYSYREDCIHLRRTKDYQDIAERNHTMLHELSHWARADHRLGPLGGSHRTPGYLEELMCDIAAAVLADELGVRRNDPDETDRYLFRQIGDNAVTLKRWRLVAQEIHLTVEYLLGQEYPIEHLIPYFDELDAVGYRGKLLVRG